MRILLLAIAALAISCADTPQSTEETPLRSVDYYVICDLCDLTISTKDGGTAQESEISSDGTVAVYSMTNVEVGAFVYVSAQNQNDTGSVTVTIVVDDVDFKTTTSNGAYVIATASGSTP